MICARLNVYPAVFQVIPLKLDHFLTGLKAVRFEK